MRLFVALWPPPDITAALAETQAKLRRIVPKGCLRFTLPEQLHVTLSFLGEVPETELDPLSTSLRDELAEEGTFQLRVQDLGAFPSSTRPRVIWAGLQGDVARAINLQGRVAAAVAPFAGHQESRDFHPHLTLARVRDARGSEQREIARALERLSVPESEPWQVTEVRLMRSELSPQGSGYSTLVEIPLLSAT